MSKYDCIVASSGLVNSLLELSFSIRIDNKLKLFSDEQPPQKIEPNQIEKPKIHDTTIDKFDSILNAESHLQKFYSFRFIFPHPIDSFCCF